MTVKLKTETLICLEDMAVQYNLNVDDLLDNALRVYRRRLEEEKIESEKQHFLSQHAKLKKEYLGLFIAMHYGQIVDYDKSFQLIHQRIRQQYGREAILIRQVEKKPERPIMVRSPKIRLGNQV